MDIAFLVLRIFLRVFCACPLSSPGLSLEVEISHLTDLVRRTNQVDLMPWGLTRFEHGGHPQRHMRPVSSK